MKSTLNRLNPKELATSSEKICKIIGDSDLWNQSTSILLYSSIQKEPNVSTLIELGISANKKISLPSFDVETSSYQAKVVRTANCDQKIGHYGVLEPIDTCKDMPLKELDLLILPGLAFSADGYRLGRGGGFYDRICLAANNSTKCGVAYCEQLLNEPIPVEPHDVKLDFVVTPSHWINASSGWA